MDKVEILNQMVRENYINFDEKQEAVLNALQSINGFERGLLDYIGYTISGNYNHTTDDAIQFIKDELNIEDPISKHFMDLENDPDILFTTLHDNDDFGLFLINDKGKLRLESIDYFDIEINPYDVKSANDIVDAMNADDRPLYKIIWNNDVDKIKEIIDDEKIFNDLVDKISEAIIEDSIRREGYDYFDINEDIPDSWKFLNEMIKEKNNINNQKG